MVVAVGDLIAVQTEVEADAPWIAKVVDVFDHEVGIVWMEGSYSSQWKVAKVKNGKKVVDWKDKVSRESIVLCGFDFTPSSRLKKKTVKELKELYSQYFSKAL